jgi:hypothetical protein
VGRFRAILRTEGLLPVRVPVRPALSLHAPKPGQARVQAARGPRRPNLCGR